VLTRSKEKDQSDVISQLEPKNVNEALEDEHWIRSMKEKLEKFLKNNVRTLVETITLGNE